MINGAATYVFNIVGDGVETQILIPLRGLKAPDPFVDQATPTGFVNPVKVGPAPGGGTITLQADGLNALLVFDTPPTTSQTEVQITALFGTKRI